MDPRPSGWWLHPNEGNRAPNCHIIIDCEAYRNVRDDGENHTYRLAGAKVHHRLSSKDPWVSDGVQRFDTARSLWDFVARYRSNNKRSIVVAHNLAYDLRIASGISHLTELGWTARPPMMDRNRVMFRWSKGDRTLVMVDSFNWLPASLEDIGARIGVAKPDLPADDAPDEVWWERCEADVTILSEAWMRLVNFVADEDLGVWRPSGAGQAMNAFRHRFMTHRLLVHHDPDARAAEREAAWSGRAEAWKHGVLDQGPYYEWDYELGYAHIMAERHVPTILRGRAQHKARWGRWSSDPRYAYLLDCTVTTELPVVPARGESGIVWPVGSFDTTLWSHEAKLVAYHGGSVDVRGAWIYDRQPALRSFAEWCIDYLAKPAPDADPICQLAVKHFTRAIVGKFGSRFRDWQHVGDDTIDQLRLWTVVDVNDPDAGNLLQLGKRIYQQGPITESEQSIPQVLSWVQAEMRVRLWWAMWSAGLDNIVYVDTDGLIVTAEGHRRLLAAGIEHLRVKRTWGALEVMGPRQIVLDGQLRAAGIPRRGHWSDGNVWNAEVWEEMPAALRRGDASSVRVRGQGYRLSGSEKRREFLPGTDTAARVLASS